MAKPAEPYSARSVRFVWRPRPLVEAIVVAIRSTAVVLLVCSLTLGLILLLPPTPALAAHFTVNEPTDGSDATPGDGQCATASNQCTLRAVVEEANALPDADVVTGPAHTYVIGNVLEIDEDVEITGSGAGTTIVDGNT